MSAKAAVDGRDLVILVAEDDSNDVLLLKRAFAKAGISACLVFVSNGQEAIHYLQGQAPFNDRVQYPYPKVVLLDLNMPRVNGLEVLEWLASCPERASLVAVVFSSCIAPADRQQADMLGAHCCMTKPLDPVSLLPMLARLSSLRADQLAPYQENCAPQVRSKS
jgi:CheY-like chemotaxis protein